VSARVGLVEAAGWALLHLVWQGALVATVLSIVLQRQGIPERRHSAALGSVLLLLVLPIITAAFLVAEDGAGEAGTMTAVSGDAARAADVTLIDQALGAVASILPVLVGTWGLGVGVMAIRWLGAHRMLARLASDGVRDPSPGAAAAFGRAGARMGVRGARLLVSDRVEVPAVVGILRPVVLLPARAAAALPPERLEEVLAHELAHVARRDGWSNLLLLAAETLLFHAPGVWRVSAAARRERERCCDAAVVRAGADPVSYARTLSELERLRGPAPRLALAAAGGELLDRVRALVRPEPAAPSSPARAVLALAAGLVLLATITNAAVSPSVAASSAVAARRRAVVVSAADGAGEFTLRLAGGRVAEATVGRVPVPAARLVQVRDSVYFLSPSGAPHFAVQVRPDGITWRPRHPRTGSNL
jgi:beta-lactamase regulating signal transducer with metallopeptidase domain